jgi:hypothetical protein
MNPFIVSPTNDSKVCSKLYSYQVNSKEAIRQLTPQQVADLI